MQVMLHVFLLIELYLNNLILIASTLFYTGTVKFELEIISCDFVMCARVVKFIYVTGNVLCLKLSSNPLSVLAVFYCVFLYYTRALRRNCEGAV